MSSLCFRSDRGREGYLLSFRVDKKLKSLWLGKMSVSQANSIKFLIEELIDAKNKPRIPSAESVEWSTGLSGRLKEQLDKVGLIPRFRFDHLKSNSPMFTYFIEADCGPIKIGKSSNPEKRLKKLQTSTPNRLSILATVDGDYEASFHFKFRFTRIHGEWFSRSHDLIKFICELGTIDLANSNLPFDLWSELENEQLQRTPRPTQQTQA